MKVTCRDGFINISLNDLLSAISADTKWEVADMLACEDDVVTYVAQQIVDRMTESGSHGLLSIVAPATPAHGLDKAWRDVAKASGEVARREIERLEKALAAKEDEVRTLRDQLSECSARSVCF